MVCGEPHAPPPVTMGRAPRYALYGRLLGPQFRSGRREEKNVACTGIRTCWLFTIPTVIPTAVVSCVCFCTSCSTRSESLSTRPAHMFHYHTWKSWSIILATVGDVSFRPRPLVGVEITSFFVLRDKQVALKPAEGYIRFRPRLLFMSASRLIKIAIPSFQVCTAESYLASLNDVTLLSPLSTNMFGQSGSITMFPPDPCSYLTRSKFLM
jgi:hypothetical protein